jgi:hypothetical protein
MDNRFHAIATILHRVPREAGELRGKHQSGVARPGDRHSPLRDVTEGWIRVAL